MVEQLSTVSFDSFKIYERLFNLVEIKKVFVRKNSLEKICVARINPYLANSPFWDPLKTLENFKVF